MDNVGKISWSRGLSIGNYNIDKDHKRLLDIYNDLAEMINTEVYRTEFARVLSEMTDYAMIHFKKEEKYMQEMSYPLTEEHISYHFEYLNKVTMFNLELIGKNLLEPDKILKFIENWWINHILKIDSEYEKFRVKENVNAVYNPF